MNEDNSWMNDASMIPAKSSDKRPMLTTWKEYQTQRPTPEEMEKWTRELRPTAWAFITGKVSGGVFVVDVDSTLAEHTVIGRWMRHLGPTKTVCTSGAEPDQPDSGKRHFYFKDSNVGKTVSWTPRAKELDDILVPPVDLKAEGGYVLAAGSKHPSGCTYVVVDESPIMEISYETVRHTLELIFRHWPLLTKILPSYKTGTRTFWCGNLGAYAFHHGFSEADALILVRTLAYAALDPFSTDQDASNAEQAVRSTYQRARDGTQVGYKGDSGPQGAGWSEGLIAEIETLPEKVRFPKGIEETEIERMRERFKLPDDDGREGGLVVPSLPSPERKEPQIAGPVVATPTAVAVPKKGSMKIEKEVINTFHIAEAIRKEMNIVGVWNGDEFVGHFRYLDGSYTRCKKFIKQSARDALGENGRNYHVAEILGHLETADTRSLTDFDAEAGKLCVENGILDIETRTLENHSPDRMFMKKLAVEFEAGATCPTIDAYFGQWAPEHKNALYEIIAHTLVSWDYPIQSVVILIGSGGNGKSTYLLIVTHFLGVENVSAIEMQSFGENRFASAKLLGKLANVCSDMDKRRIKSTSEFKKLTGGDPIQGEIKHGALFTFFNKSKMIFSLNELPQSPDDTEAFYRRVFKMRFNAKFKGDNRKSQRAIITECHKEFPGLLNKCLDVLPGLLERHSFEGDSDDVDAKKENYHRESRPVYGFWEDRLVYKSQEESGGEVVDGLTKDEIFTGFRKYRESQELSVLSYDTFFRKLKEEFLNRDLPFEIGRPRVEGGKQKRVVVGLTFRSESPSLAKNLKDGGSLEENTENMTHSPSIETPSGPLLSATVRQETGTKEKEEAKEKVKEEAGGSIIKDVNTKVSQPRLGSMDIESVGLDIEDPENRILSVALYGDEHPEGEVFAFENEGDTISAFVQEAQKYDALLGWNSDGFDMPLLAARLRFEEIELSAVGMPLVLDCMRVHQFMLRKGETSMTLDHVSKKHLGEGKLPFDPTKTLETFKNDRNALARYNLHDTKLVWRLNKNFGYWETFDAIVKRAGLDDYNRRKFAGISQKEDGGFAWWRPLMGLVTKFCHANGLGVPGWPTDEEKAARREQNIERPGGFVETPKPGHHKSVIEFDFKSLYPTIIQTFNLGADTAYENGDIKPPFGRYTSSRRSIIASILDDLVVERTEVKDEYENRKAVGASTEELAALKGKIEALKILHNAYYGQMYAPFSPLYHYNSAKNITTVGQECVKLMLARMRELGFEVIAGDTDSTYVKVPFELFNKESALKLAEQLTAHISVHIKEKYGRSFVGSFDFKSLISDMYTKVKKFYARLEDGKGVKDIELKGYVRGNTPEIQRNLQRKVFETMFSGGDIALMLGHEREDFVIGKDYTGFISWMQVHKKEGNTAQARAKRVLEEAGVVFMRYEQVGFLLVGRGKKQRRLAAHRLPDSTIEWLFEGDITLHRETELLTQEEAEKMWNQIACKLHGVSI